MRLAIKLASFNIKGHFEAFREENRTLLKAFCPEPELQHFFAEFSFDGEVEMGMFRYHQANCLKKSFDWEEDFQRALSTNLLILGSGTTGDPVALDLIDY